MRNLRTINAVEAVYGTEDPDQVLLDDPVESYHEASKLYRSRALRQTNAYLLSSNKSALVSTTRSAKRLDHRPRIALPSAQFPDVSLGTLLERRRSTQTFASKAIGLEQLATILFAAYGVTQRMPLGSAAGEQLFRTAPSGGALFPYDVFVAVHRVDDLESALYWYDSREHGLVSVSPHSATEALAAGCVYPQAIQTSAVTLLLSATFWRSRFKYRFRAYRFTLLEAGHVAQNALLAAEALGLGALPLGGFYDADVDRLLGNDGVNEGVVYCIGVGVL